MNSYDETNHDPRAQLRQRLVADLLGESDAAEHAALEAQIAADPTLAAERERLAATIGLVSELAADVPAERLSPEAAERLRSAAEGGGRVLAGPGSGGRAWYASPVLRAAAGLMLVLGAFALWRGSQGVAWRSLSVETADARRPAQEPTAEGPYLYNVWGDSVQEPSANERKLAAASATRQKEGAPVERGLDAGTLDELRSLGYTGAAAAAEEAANGRFGVQSTLDGGEVSSPGGLAKAEGGIYRGPGDSIPPSRDSSTAQAGAGGASVPLVTLGESSLAKRVAHSETQSVGVARVQFDAASASGAKDGPSSPGPVALPNNGVTGFAPTAVEPVTTGSDEFFLGRGEAEAERSRFDDKAFNDVMSVEQVEKRLRGLGYIGSDDEDDARRLDRLRQMGYSVGNAEDAAKARAGLRKDELLRREMRPLSPHERARTIELLLADCRRRPNEAPRDMFYRWWGDNPFEYARTDALSTFAVDVDTASYTLARRYLVDGHLPTKAQIRTEEFVNYFQGDVPAPTEDTFAVATELAPSPFHRAGDAWTLRVVLRGREVTREERKPLALTFVVDVSGSMKEQNRLELVKHALRLLVGELDARDSISIVAFSNETRLVLPMTSARNRGLIESAIHPLAPQGGTNVQAGLRMGYEAALAGLDAEAHNRVVLLSDGVGNIGETDAQALGREVESARKRGVWLNTVGVGMGNHNDAFLEQLADKGDGICNYIDDEREARRALVENFTGAFEPIAKDVKIQVEFDPAQVERYRLLGYENRAVADQDFRNDAVDAGEVGAGHQVVALYEVVRTGDGDGPLATVRVRWKPAGAAFVSNQMADLPAREAAWTIDGSKAGASFAATTPGFRQSVLVAQLAEVLRRSIHARDDSLETLLAESRKLAPELADPDFDEFVRMVERTIELIASDWGRYDDLARRLDRLRMQHYLKAKLEDVARDLDQARLQELDAQIRDLESEIRAQLEKEPEAEPIRSIGYTDSVGDK